MLDRSIAIPMTEVFELMSSVIGICALRESVAILVVVNTPVIFSAEISVVRGAFERVNSPISSEAVDATKRMSCISGGKAFKRCMN